MTHRRAAAQDQVKFEFEFDAPGSVHANAHSSVHAATPAAARLTASAEVGVVAEEDAEADTAPWRTRHQPIYAAPVYLSTPNPTHLPIPLTNLQLLQFSNENPRTYAIDKTL